jgi:hypothetical protein
MAAPQAARGPTHPSRSSRRLCCRLPPKAAQIEPAVAQSERAARALKHLLHARAVALPALAAVLINATAAGQPLPALHIVEPVTVDGRLDEAAWRQVEPVSDFKQVQPDEGDDASERTEVRLLYDDAALYVGFRNFDAHAADIVARLARRDDDTAADSVTVQLDTRGDHAAAFTFCVNAANVQRDAIRTGDDVYSYDWDAIWTSAVSVDAEGWTAELRIPLTALRFDRGQEQTWRVQLTRFIARNNELQLWAFKPRSEYGELARFRPVEGLEGLPAPHGLELRPFAVMQLRWQDAPAGVGAPRGFDHDVSVGLDLRYGLTSGLSLDVALLPDFGQVDQDPALLNLTTFEVLLPEKRPFFLESAELYRMRDAYGDGTFTQLFYSRRIGLKPLFDAPDGTFVSRSPDATQIYGAAKISGRVGEAVSVGLLDAVTGPESAVLQDGAGAQSNLATAPLSNYAVARVSAALDHGFTAGATLTDVHRAEQNGLGVYQGLCLTTAEQPDPNGRCARDVSAAEADAAWSSEGGDWIAAAHVLGSRVHAGPSHLMRDGTLVSPGDLGFGARAEVAKPSGLIFAHALFESYSPRLELNEVGYLQRQNLHRLFTQLGVQFFKKGPVQVTKTAVEVFGRNSWDGAEILRGVNLNNYTQWNNFWTTWLEFQWNATAYENRELLDGTRFERPALFGIEWELTSNPSKPVAFDWAGNFALTHVGASIDTQATLAVQASDRLRVSLAPTLLRVTGDIRRVDTLGTGDASVYRFGLQDALGTGVTLRTSLTFTPALSLQLYAQLFFADVQYRALYEAQAQGTPRYVTLPMLQASSADPGLYTERDVALNVNLVFRWEVLPGSIVYLVYTHTQGGTPQWDPDSVRPRLDFAGLGRVPVVNAFLVKASYYFAR